MDFYAWVLRKLGDLSLSFEYGLNASSKKYDGKNKYIRITDIDEKTNKLNTNNITSPNTDLEKVGNYLLSENDILFARTGASVGKTYHYSPSDGIIYYAGFLIRAKIKKEYDSEFVFQNTLTDKYNNYVKITSQRSGQPGINAKEYANYMIAIPVSNINEQEAIGSLFKKLDDLIALQQRKIDTLKLFKKALLQQMFPEKGKDIPKVRFNCSYEKWEKHILGDYLTIPVKERIVVKNTEDLMTVKLNLGGIVPGTNRETLSLGATNYFRRHAGQLIYGKQNFFNGSIAIVPTKLDGKATSGDVPSLNISNINVDYLFSFITRKSYWKQKEVTASGTGSKRIHEKTLQKFNIEVPKTVKEQKYIGNLFGSIDIVIKFDEKIINSFKTLKQALLQNLFI